MQKTITNEYIEYIETGNQKHFVFVYNNLKNVMLSEFGSNPIFDDYNFINTFEDIYQILIIKLEKNKYKFDKTKNLTSYAFRIFDNIIKDEIRKIKNKDGSYKMEKVRIADINYVY